VAQNRGATNLVPDNVHKEQSIVCRRLEWSDEKFRLTNVRSHKLLLHIPMQHNNER
jgi:hypothetical protein